MKTKLFFLVPLFLLFSFVSCNEDDSVQESQAQYKSFNKPGDDTIFEIVADFNAKGEFNELFEALVYVQQAGLEPDLVAAVQSNEVQLTVFAPSDAAFDELYATLSSVSGQTIDEITDLPATVVFDVLLYHIVEGRRGSNSVVPKKNYKNVETLLEVPFQVNKDLEIMDVLGLWKPVIGTLDPNPGAGETPGTNANISASNGMIHSVNHVLVPLTLQQIKDLFGV
jgi:uncharacterized surface protein with fasciclin (FAS1) repeats